MPRQNFAWVITLFRSGSERCCPTKKSFADWSSWRWRSRFFARATCLLTRLKRPCGKSTRNRNSAAFAVRNANGSRIHPAAGFAATEARRNIFAAAELTGTLSTHAADVLVAAIIGCGQRVCGAASIRLTKIGTQTKQTKRSRKPEFDTSTKQSNISSTCELIVGYPQKPLLRKTNARLNCAPLWHAVSEEP